MDMPLGGLSRTSVPANAGKQGPIRPRFRERTSLATLLSSHCLVVVCGVVGSLGIPNNRLSLILLDGIP